jgi:hypothetical protein
MEYIKKINIWFLNLFTDYRWARKRLGGKWQKWVPTNGKNKGYWVQGIIIPHELARDLAFTSELSGNTYIATQQETEDYYKSSRYRGYL